VCHQRLVRCQAGLGSRPPGARRTPENRSERSRSNDSSRPPGRLPLIQCGGAESRRGLLKRLSLGRRCSRGRLDPSRAAVGRNCATCRRIASSVLHSREYSIWAAGRIGCSPSKTRPAPDRRAGDVAAKADAFLAPLHDTDRKEPEAAPRALRQCALQRPAGWPAPPFTAMSPASRTRTCAAGKTRALHPTTGYQAMKRLCCALYFSAAETFAAVGYAGPPTSW